MLKSMGSTYLRRIGLPALFLAALPAVADTQFRVRQMARNDVPFGKGQCDIRLQVDNEVEVAVRRDLVSIRTISGRDARDDGSECNEPLPDREMRDFNFEVRDSRNDIRLLDPPSRRNNFAAVVRIRDTSGGEGRYHFRLTWAITGVTGYPGQPTGRPAPPVAGPPPGYGGGRDRPFESPGGFAWNNVIHYNGRGRGTSQMSGSGSQRLSDANVDIDRGGRVIVSFRTDRGRPLTFSGQIIGRDRDVLKADVAGDDRLRLRGPMYISVDDRSNVYRISLDAGNGRDRMQLDWQGR